MDNRTKIYLSPPHMGREEQMLVGDAFASNWIAPLGPHVEGFECELAETVGARAAVALSSGTAAIHLALRLLEVGMGDTVFCSSLTFVASANPILYQGALPIFIDSEPDSWNLSPAALQRAFADAEKAGRLPKAVIAVNLYGQSADMDLILDICGRYGTPVIEDAAESLGATYKGRQSGTFGILGIYSFSGNKIITTSSGGMLVSDDAALIHRARFLATQARDSARHYQHSAMGYNYRLSNVLAAIGRGQLRLLEERIEAKRQIFDRYVGGLGDLPGVSFMEEKSYGRSNRWLTALTLDPESGCSPEEILLTLEEENIEARPVWKPLHMQPLFAEAPYYPHLPNESVSDRLFQTGICLPSGTSLSEQDQQRVIDCIQACFRRRAIDAERAILQG